jgi:hypothetical protein
MRFYAVSTEAVELTFRALQKLDRERKGSHRPSRALRVATLFGHLQCRARGGTNVQVGCRQLAEAWHLHPREIRADLQDLEAIGWLSCTSSTTGLCIRLHEPEGHLDLRHGSADLEAVDLEAVNDSPVEPIPSKSEVPASAIAQPRVMAEVVSEPSGEPKRSPEESSLIAQFAATYNQHKPGTWPAYKPTGTLLASRLRQAIRHAGSPEAFEAALIRALRAMPEFWRTEYPQERNGADCARALLQVDRASEGRGVEHWHVFAWGAYTGRLSGGIGGNTPGVGHHRPAANSGYHPDHRHACKLLLWDGHEWKGRGMEAAKLPASERQRLAEILEAAGFGKPGTAAEQFAKETQR